MPPHSSSLRFPSDSDHLAQSSSLPSSSSPTNTPHRFSSSKSDLHQNLFHRLAKRSFSLKSNSSHPPPPPLSSHNHNHNHHPHPSFSLRHLSRSLKKSLIPFQRPRSVSHPQSPHPSLPQSSRPASDLITPRNPSSPPDNLHPSNLNSSLSQSLPKPGSSSSNPSSPQSPPDTQTKPLSKSLPSSTSISRSTALAGTTRPLTQAALDLLSLDENHNPSNLLPQTADSNHFLAASSSQSTTISSSQISPHPSPIAVSGQVSLPSFQHPSHVLHGTLHPPDDQAIGKPFIISASPAAQEIAGHAQLSDSFASLAAPIDSNVHLDTSSRAASARKQNSRLIKKTSSDLRPLPSRKVKLIRKFIESKTNSPYACHGHPLSNSSHYYHLHQFQIHQSMMIRRRRKNKLFATQSGSKTSLILPESLSDINQSIEEEQHDDDGHDDDHGGGLFNKKRSLNKKLGFNRSGKSQGEMGDLKKVGKINIWMSTVLGVVLVVILIGTTTHQHRITSQGNSIFKSISWIKKM